MPQRITENAGASLRLRGQLPWRFGTAEFKPSRHRRYGRTSLERQTPKHVSTPERPRKLAAKFAPSIFDFRPPLSSLPSTQLGACLFAA